VNTEAARSRLAALLGDLAAEGGELEALLRSLSPDEWAYDTQSRGWTVAHQVGHLENTERLMISAATDEGEFRRLALSTRIKPDFSEDLTRRGFCSELLASWVKSRDGLHGALAGMPPGARIPWMGPSMSVASAATARIMEIWAHGEDVYLAVGARRKATERLRHIAHLAVATRDYSFVNRGLTPPTEPFRVEVLGPDGAIWGWGPEGASQRVVGEAYDFALLATRRIHRADARVDAFGPDAKLWLRTIQAFAGRPGPRRRPLGDARESAQES
jgi:uncharacterized protein (TIGR03084 family)